MSSEMLTAAHMRDGRMKVFNVMAGRHSRLAEAALNASGAVLLACWIVCLLAISDRGPNDHINIRIVQTMISGIPFILCFRSRIQDPYVYVVCWPLSDHMSARQFGSRAAPKPAMLQTAGEKTLGHTNSPESQAALFCLCIFVEHGLQIRTAALQSTRSKR